MEEKQLKKLLQDVAEKKINTDDAFNQLRELPYEDMGFAKVDHHRSLRTGFPEVIFCKGKQLNHIAEISTKLYEKSGFVMATKATPEIAEVVKAVLPNATYHELANIILVGERQIKKLDKKVLILSAGTADLPVAEEAAITAEVAGVNVTRLYDAGVAGVHRLLHNKKHIDEADVIVVVAGMEGALASVVGGLANCPVVAVPTSVGYGANFGGLSALLAMLNSCAPGVSVVNIDNGFGAGYCAGSICRSQK